jgi:predicted NAD-dependent protein-ADP-ribosyltransferase YbiA (DUF1768 family)
MVASKINPSIRYNDTNKILSDDHSLESSTYDITFEKIDPKTLLTVTFGKVNYTYSSKSVLYYPMYLVVDEQVKAQIGVIEVLMEELPSLIDEDGDLDPERIPDPILYDFVTKEYLKKFENNENLEQDDLEDTGKQLNDNELDVIDLTGKTPSDKSDDYLSLADSPKKTGEPNETTEQQENPEDIFKKDIYKKMDPILIEETKKDALQLKSEYEESPSNDWIAKFMKNNKYKIFDNEGGGDCFFYVVRDAFKQIGQETTVEKLRNLLANEVTDEIFQEYYKLYLSLDNELKENEKENLQLKQFLKELKNRVNQNVTNKEEHSQLIKQAKDATAQLEKLKKDRAEQEYFLKYNFGFMKDIDTLQKYKDFIRTSRYWIDMWGISTLENKLNMKMIIFSEEAFDEGSFDSVLNCGEANKDIEKSGKFTPNYYIMTSYTGTHYTLIAYKYKKILTFSEIPYDVKMLVMNKCMEKNAGIYHIIQDFRNLKTKFGLSADEGKIEQDDNEMLTGKLYDPTIQFIYYSKSQNKPKPGSGSGELIPKDKKNTFLKLSKIDDWRKKLDDLWSNAPFSLENHRWASIEHFYQASKFKKGYPDFYLQFSLDSESELSKDPTMAKTAGGKKSNTIRPKDVKLDPDFYGERNLEVRNSALLAKFTQNLDMKELLALTYPAKLLKFIRGSPPEVDEQLMKIRQDLLETK